MCYINGLFTLSSYIQRQVTENVWLHGDDQIYGDNDRAYI